MRRVVAAGLAGAALVLIPAPGPVAGASRQPAKSIAAEVCEPMVRNAVEASLGAPLPAAQQGAWAGRTFTCTYPLTGGQLVLAVDDLRTKTKARAAYRTLNRAVTHPTRLNGLGDRAYQAPDGTIIAVKDQFLLHIDPSAAPPGVVKGDLAFAVVVAVMSCWTGGT